MGAWYTTREAVAAAPDIDMSAASEREIDSAIRAGSESVEGLLKRTFYPWTGTRRFDYPNEQTAGIGRLWFNQHELISATSVVSGGVTISPDDYFLRPYSGPPYRALEIDRASSAALASNSGTSQQAIAITGVWMGCELTEVSAGTLAEALDTSETAVDGTLLPEVGVGTVLRTDSERMIVTDRAWRTSGQTLQTDLTASNANVTVTVTDGTAFHAGEFILLDSERMLVTEVSGNTLTVKRAVNGTVLAAHSGSTVYYSRTFTVERGALGTTAATHDSGAAVVRHVVPGLIAELALAYTLNYLVQRNTGYVHVKDDNATLNKSNSNRRTVPFGRGLPDIERDALWRYGRRARMRAV